MSTFQQILNIDPKHTASIYNLGVLHWETKETEKALKYYDNCGETEKFPLGAFNKAIFNYTKLSEV